MQIKKREGTLSHRRLSVSNIVLKFDPLTSAQLSSPIFTSHHKLTSAVDEGAASLADQGF